MRTGLLTPCLLFVVLAASGCVHDRRRSLVLVPEGALAADAQGRPALASRPRRPRGAPASGATPAAPDGGGLEASRVPGARRGEAADPPRPPEPAPTTAYAGHRPLPEGVSLEQSLREKFLEAPTVVEAQKVTLHVPPAYAAQATLTGASLSEEGPGRRTAVGGASLVLRRLTVRAARVTLVAREDGSPDVSLTARGNVRFHADLPASVIDERDLKCLLLRNDGYTPLR